MILWNVWFVNSEAVGMVSGAVARHRFLSSGGTGVRHVICGISSDKDIRAVIW
jgi:hypothetical protein